MTDSTGFTETYERHRKATIRANDENKRIVFDALAAASISAVSVMFDGEGDSGQIESIAAFTNGKSTELPEATITIQLARWGTDDLSPCQSTLSEAIETLCYGYLEQEHGGWENNDGAYGEFTFEVAKRSIALAFNGRYMDTFTYNHSF